MEHLGEEFVIREIVEHRKFLEAPPGGMSPRLGGVGFGETASQGSTTASEHGLPMTRPPDMRQRRAGAIQHEDGLPQGFLTGISR
ncbi:hypothetical protein ACN28S_04965 [Cystobacter fuscus]